MKTWKTWLRRLSATLLTLTLAITLVAAPAQAKIQSDVDKSLNEQLCPDCNFTGVNPNSFSLVALGTKGNVYIGTKLEVDGDLQATGKLSSQNGKVRRDFVTWNTTERGSNPIQIKTNIPKKSNVMYRILVEGYSYGVGAAINSDVVGYTFAGAEKIIQDQANDYANGVSISQYYSSDGYVVVKLTTTNTYCLGFSASAWFTNPNGNGFEISATVHHQFENL